MTPITVTGHIIDAAANPLANVQVTFQLANYGSTFPRVIGTGSIGPIPINQVSETNGSGFFSIQLIGNDQINPGGGLAPPQTVYNVFFGDSQIALGPFSFTGSGPYSLDTAIPLSGLPVVPAIPVPQAVVEFGTVSGAVSLSLSSGSMQHMTLGGNVTLSTGTIPAAQYFLLRVTQSSSGGYSVSFPASMRGAGPVSLLANSENVQLFASDASGSTLYAVGPMVAE